MKETITNLQEELAEISKANEKASKDTKSKQRLLEEVEELRTNYELLEDTLNSRNHEVREKNK